MGEDLLLPVDGAYVDIGVDQAQVVLHLHFFVFEELVHLRLDSQVLKQGVGILEALSLAAIRLLHRLYRGCIWNLHLKG
jgi:hypothetical protein